MVEYASSRSEIWRAYWFAWRCGMFLKIVHLSTALFIFLVVLPARGVIIAATIALNIVTYFPFVPLLLFKPQTRILRIDRQGFLTQIGRRSSTRSWKNIARIERMPSGEVLLIGRSTNMMIIPRRAFATQQQLDVFFGQVAAWHAEARE